MPYLSKSDPSQCIQPKNTSADSRLVTKVKTANKNYAKVSFYRINSINHLFVFKNLGPLVGYSGCNFLALPNLNTSADGRLVTQVKTANKNYALVSFYRMNSINHLFVFNNWDPLVS